MTVLPPCLHANITKYVLCSRVKHSMYKYSTSTLHFEVFCALLQTFHILGRFLAFMVSKFADKLMNLSKVFNSPKQSDCYSKLLSKQRYFPWCCIGADMVFQFDSP